MGNRVVKFRGKRVDNGEWAYGYYQELEESENHYYWINEPNGDITDVTPETVGQYTGLKDRNGVEIYEGDVLHWDSHWGWYVEYENGAFRRIPLNDIQRINWRHHTLQQEGLDTWEIIGNIHDNPELMGKKK